MSKLFDVRGRITYISSHAKQENLYAVYGTTECCYWTELARCNQQEFHKSGTEGKCIEAREFIIARVSALHHNKRKTNYHIHLIFSERELLPEPIEKDRNTQYVL